MSERSILSDPRKTSKAQQQTRSNILRDPRRATRPQPTMKTLSIPAPRELQAAVADASDILDIPVRAFVEEAVADFVVAADADRSLIPPDDKLERPREGQGTPIMSHLIDSEVHRRLKRLTVDLSRHGHRRYYMNELVLYALRRKLAGL